MLDHAFQRRREIERMLLSGKRLTVPKLMAMYSVGKNAIRRDFEVIGEELPVIAKQGYNGGYSLMDGAGNTRTPYPVNNWNVWKNSLWDVRGKTGKPSCQSYMNSGRTVKGIHKKSGSFQAGNVRGGAAWTRHTGEWKSSAFYQSKGI